MNALLEVSSLDPIKNGRFDEKDAPCKVCIFPFFQKLYLISYDVDYTLPRGCSVQGNLNVIITLAPYLRYI